MVSKLCLSLRKNDRTFWGGGFSVTCIVPHVNLSLPCHHEAFLGVSCGTLMGANIVLPFVACLFHDVNTMAALFIHMMPPMVMYTFMWNSSAIRAAWPNVFNLTYMENIRFFSKSGLFIVPGSVSSVHDSHLSNCGM